MEDYPSNANKAKPKMEKIAESSIKKEPLAKKIFHAVIEGDLKDIGEYLVMDILVPELKRGAYNIGVGALDRIFYKNGKNNTSLPGSRQEVYHNAYNGRRNHDEREEKARRQLKVSDYPLVQLPSRADAERVLDNLRCRIDEFGMVSVADFYDAVGVSFEHTCCKFGWRNLDNVPILMNEGKYMIDFPNFVNLE